MSLMMQLKVVIPLVLRAVAGLDWTGKVGYATRRPQDRSHCKYKERGKQRVQRGCHRASAKTLPRISTSFSGYYLPGDVIRTGIVIATRSDGGGKRRSIRLDGRFVEVATAELVGQAQCAQSCTLLYVLNISMEFCSKLAVTNQQLQELV